MTQHNLESRGSSSLILSVALLMTKFGVTFDSSHHSEKQQNKYSDRHGMKKMLPSISSSRFRDNRSYRRFSTIFRLCDKVASRSGGNIPHQLEPAFPLKNTGFSRTTRPSAAATARTCTFKMPVAFPLKRSFFCCKIVTNHSSISKTHVAHRFP